MNKLYKIIILLLTILVISENAYAQVPSVTQDPKTVGVIEGQAANFTIVATGADPKSYQWQKNGIDIIDDTLSTKAITSALLSDNGAIFRCIVTNAEGADTSASALLYVTASGSRVTASEILRYDFDETTGTTINDNAGGAPLNTTINSPSSVIWTPNSLIVDSQADITSSAAATKVFNAATVSNELTVEAWIKPANITQGNSGPARIMTISVDGTNRNIALTQATDSYELRLRTTTTNNNGLPALLTASGTATTNLTHVVFTRSADGTAKVYINGVESISGTFTGDLSNWDASYKLRLADEFISTKTWLGTFYLTSIYDRALASAEVSHNYSQGVTVDQVPFVIKNPADLGLVEGNQADFTVEAVGEGTLSYQWQRNNVDIGGANSATFTIPSVALSDNGDNFRCIVSSIHGADTSNSAQLIVTPISGRVTYGLQVLYNFQEGSGNIINDISSVGSPLNLVINTPGSVNWTQFGLQVNSEANIASTIAAVKLYNAVTATNELTIEAWLMPTRDDLGSPSVRIISYSGDYSNRNVSLLQKTNQYDSRLRTSTTDNNGSPSTLSQSGALTTNLTHVVFIRKSNGTTKIFINGSENVSNSNPSDLSNWNQFYNLYLANEAGGGRAFLGLFNLVAFYDRALTPVEITHNYNQGATNLASVPAPSSLNASATQIGKISLTWLDNSSNEDGFIIERASGSPLVWQTIDSIGVNSTSYIDSVGLSENTTYSYRVKGYNLFKSSTFSNVASAKTLISPITAPSNLIAVQNNPNIPKVDLSWTDNSNNEDGFYIIRGKEPDFNFTTFDAVGANVTSYSDTSVSVDTSYSYKVQAFNADTTSAVSGGALVAVTPVELTTFTYTASKNGIKLVWETATETNNAGFSIERSEDNNQFEELAFVNGQGNKVEYSKYSFQDETALSGKYYYRLKQIDFDGTFDYSDVIEIDLGVPVKYALEQNYPNPFNPSTTIKFSLPASARVTIDVYNTLGQKLSRILDGNYDAGIHKFLFNASEFPSGVYFYNIVANGQDGNNFIQTKKMILMK